MNQTRKAKSDYWLSLAVFGLIFFGLIMIYSVSKYYSLQITNEATDKYYLLKQLKFLGIGIVAWIAFQSIDYHYWQKKTTILFWMTIILLLLPLIPFGHGGAGARWIDLKVVSFQPSEVAKLTLILYLSGWIASKNNNIAEIKKLFVPFIVIVFAIAGLMLIQKDLGTLSIIVAICASIIYIGGASAYQMLAGGGLAVFLLWVAVKIEPYRMQRLLTFLNPNDTSGAAYHIKNALIAIGSGGLWGLGFGQSKQKYLYLPEAHTDSIFAIISEELGLIRAGAVIVVFVFIAMRGFKIAAKAPDIFGRLVAVGITTWLTFQMIVNIGAIIGVLPLTGVPLPFISYGGSSLVILLSAVGILVNISKQQQLSASQHYGN